MALESIEDVPHINFDSGTPIYLQIAQDIRDRIVNGHLNAGDQLMSTTQYATNFRINPATANKAFNLLQSEGLIYKQRGIGMFITEEAASILREDGRHTYRSESLEPALREGLALGFSAAELRSIVDTVLEG